MEGCFRQYNQHLPIRIQQKIQEREVKLAPSKQQKKKRWNGFYYIRTDFTTCASVSCEQVNDSDK